ncbi:hypothetical protein AB0L14_37900 [Streptomyces sp. NPDC052727]|uniref:hypothetical protein n=1 Tax=Streptomyces sp. NPDC052727 TaxID=3154854 RepID=UPI00341A2B73
MPGEHTGRSTFGDREFPFLRDKEDVPHEHALPDLYALTAIRASLPIGMKLVGDPAD